MRSSARAAQNDSGGHHPRRVFNFLGRRPERSHEMELCSGILADRRGGIRYLQRVVTIIELRPVTSPGHSRFSARTCVARGICAVLSGC